jgi:Raf kinase inhibitor-like YbhB/YbcL family protein
MTFALHSPAFTHGAPIPPRYTADGDNVSPPLEWQDVPDGTRTFALVMVDPDAPRGTFKHWALFNIDPARDGLPERVVPDEWLSQGVNDYGHAHYDGPNPPAGHGTHRYHFRLMALGVDRLDLPPSPTVDDVREAAKEFVLGEAELIGTYTH